MNLHLFNANGAPLSLALGNTPGFTWTEEPSALKARVINAMSRALSDSFYFRCIIAGAMPQVRHRESVQWRTEIEMSAFSAKPAQKERGASFSLGT
jgi:hypothetical protein